MKNILFLLALILISCQSANYAEQFYHLDWLIGTWEGKAGETSFYEEWTRVSDTELRNINFEIIDGDTANSNYASILARGSDIIYKGSSELKATSVDANQVIFENDHQKYIFRLDDQGRWIAKLDNRGAKVEYVITRTSPVAELIKSNMDQPMTDTIVADTTERDTIH